MDQNNTLSGSYNVLGVATGTRSNWKRLEENAEDGAKRTAKERFLSENEVNETDLDLEFRVEVLDKASKTYSKFLGSQWSGHCATGNVDIYDEAYAFAVYAKVTVIGEPK